MEIDAIIIDEDDNVATALRDIESRERVIISIGENFKECLINERIPYGHKFAVKDIARGENIFKYGEVIGRATHNIAVGNHAHIQNIESLRGRGDLEYEE